MMQAHAIKITLTIRAHRHNIKQMARQQVVQRFQQWK